ncbi:Plant invertase/pectin methylesterase inhibitor superfamily protein [Perilla frutescens var. hirtella]|uniref:Plant invertase/pectin methylesterase inhibitor superfamily protein n=1 Tax=Perilla frutescens var. hirtella TaxID=608512 RepID=A0AAD4ISP1_PERFH|nr:Plant invertase/pectin methylesterase inhibitor superfamily protein [Perilla frutescens var. hirtella]
MRINLRPFFLIITAFVTAYAAAEPAAAPEAAANASDFIRTSCGTTQYPDLCYQSLYGYANAVQQDPARLAAVAVGVSLSRATFMSIYVANLTRQADYGVAEPRAASALRDCFSVFRDAVGQIRGSLKQMRRLSGAGEELRFQMSNVQTWMSAALTNEDTCTDGFDGVSDSQLKADVCDRTVEVKEVTSNALALVNSFVDKVVVP